MDCSHSKKRIRPYLLEKNILKYSTKDKVLKRNIISEKMSLLNDSMPRIISKYVTFSKKKGFFFGLKSRISGSQGVNETSWHFAEKLHFNKVFKNKKVFARSCLKVLERNKQTNKQRSCPVCCGGGGMLCHTLY